MVRAVQECLQAVLWNGTVGIAPFGHDLPKELAAVPLIDIAPSRVVAAWNGVTRIGWSGRSLISPQSLTGLSDPRPAKAGGRAGRW